MAKLKTAKEKKVDFPKLIFSLALPFLAGGIGSFFTFPSINSWYQTLNKPLFNPLDFVFGPFWTILYVLMGLSFYLVWISKNSKIKSRAIQFFLIQLALNATWSIVFFGLKSPFLGLLIIVFLWLAIVLTIEKFVRVSKPSAYLLIPYILWVSFAAILNFSILILN